MHRPTSMRSSPLAILAIWAGFFPTNLLVAQESRSSSTNRNRATIGLYDRPNGVYQSRSVVYAQDGMACTSDPRATQAAIDVLRRGGTAVDAAIAANAMLGVVEPMSCGIGGDLFAIVWDASSQKLHGLNASGRSPMNLTIDKLREQNLKEIPLHGPLSWSVPGCVSGWYDLHQRFGKMAMPDVLASSIQLADRGFPVAPVIGQYFAASQANLRKDQDAAETFLVAPKGNAVPFAERVAPREGTLFRNPRLAATYRLIGQQGPDAFYKGSIAERIVAFSQSHGGYFSRDDFAKHQNEWIEPVSTNYRGYDVWELPPNGQGIAALQMLNILERYDVRSMGWGSPEYTHLLIEAKKLAFADRARFYADMQFSKVPVAQLISKEYAKQQAARIDLQKAMVDTPPGNPAMAQGDTVYLCVVDKDRNCCSLIQSNFHGFGSYLVPGDVGFALQNRGALFTLEDKHPNVYEPGKRPFHTIIPAMMTREGKPYMVFGVMGGDMQPQGHVQIVVNHVDFGMNIQLAGDAGRVRHDGSASPTGTPMEKKGGTLLHESTLPAATLEKLRSMGHQLKVDRSGMGGYQAILIDWDNKVLQGATESRKDGVAMGIDFN